MKTLLFVIVFSSHFSCGCRKCIRRFSALAHSLFSSNKDTLSHTFPSHLLAAAVALLNIVNWISICMWICLHISQTVLLTDLLTTCAIESHVSQVCGKVAEHRGAVMWGNTKQASNTTSQSNIFYGWIRKSWHENDLRHSFNEATAPGSLSLFSAYS